MNERGRRQAEEKRISEEAAEWLVLRDRGFSAKQQDGFFHWLAADPRHGEWLALHQQTWRRLDLLAQWQPEHSGEPNPDLLARPKTRHRWFWAGSLLAAASVAVLLVIRPQAPAVKTIASEKIMAPVAISPAASYERRVLEDGSVVELNRGAAVTVDYRPEVRAVTLVRGVAHFIVAKNKQRPFVVTAGEVAVRAVGTAFNVTVDERNVDVLVTEGKVHLEGDLFAAKESAGQPLLVAGQRATIARDYRNASARITDVSSDEIERMMDWQPRMLDFNAQPLAQVAATFNRHNYGQEQIFIVDADLASMSIVASFRSDNVNGFVRLLEATSDVQVERSGVIIRLRKRSQGEQTAEK